MDLYLIGIITNIIGLIGAGAVLALGFSVYSREKSAGVIRIQLLIYSLASFMWGASYAIIGFLKSVNAAQTIRIVGVAGIDVFLLAEFFVVTGLAKLKPLFRKTTRIIATIILIVDFILYSRRYLDEFYIENGLMTWVGHECIERTYHEIVVMLLFISMGILGIIAYRRYEFKRQKKFLVLFYIANLLLMAFSAIDTFYVFGYPLPTSGIGAVICTIILCIGTSKNNAFGISASDMFNNINDLMNDGVLILDNNRKIVFANPYIITLMADKNYKGKEIKDIFEVDSTKIDYYFEGAKREEIGGLHLNVKNSPIICNSKLVCAKDKHGEIYCYIMSISDITKEMNMVEELSQANAAKSHFLTSISHEIRTPINSVLGMNEMIRRESKDESVLNYSSNIDKSGRQLLSIIDDILDITKIESGKLELFNSSYDFSSMINDMYLIVSPKIAEKGLDIILNINPNVPSWLYGDEVRVNQIIMNLIGNAIKYTDEGFIMIECDYEEIDSDNINLIVSVRDTGRGIRNVKNSHLFDTFTRLDEKNNRSIEGIGLGLAITKSVLDYMGGNIDVESVYGVGSKFTVKIPQRISNRIPVGNLAQRIEAVSDNRLSYKESFTAPDARILVVDDVEMNLMVVTELLKGTKMAVDCASSGKEAIRKCNENYYHVILMDHMMPQMDGIECLKIIRQSEGDNKTTPVIVLTANAIVGMKDMYLNEGFNDYLSKPIDGEKLEAMIKKYLPDEIVM